MDKLALFYKVSRKISKFPVKLSEITDIEIQKHPLINHIQKFPLLRWKDVYKFLMQGTCGWGHLKNSGKLDGVKFYLEEEYESIGDPLPEEDLYDLLNTKTKIVRLNLRVWKQRFEDNPDQIWNLMLSALEKTPESTEFFLEQWSILISIYEKGVIQINQKRKRKYNKLLDWLNFVLEFVKETEKISDIPLLHHSSVYRKNYSPSYRLVIEDDLMEFLEKN